jgi:8-oxo-dGTP pyrophosphatase MutT (NUDIX family)
MNVRHDHVTVFVARRIDNAWQLLQVRRRADDYLGGTWQTVRGTMEAGETAVQTALRELREETGLVPIEFYTLGIVETFYIAAEDAMWHSPAFLAIVEPAAPIQFDAEHDAHRWINLADTQREFMWPSERPLIDAITREIFGDGLSKPLLLIRL